MNTTTDSIQETGFYCPLCGEPLPANATECTKCDWVPGYLRQEEERGRRNPRDIAAAAFSLVIPGAGHYFKGYVLAAWLLLLLGVPVIVVMAFTFTMFFGWLMVPTYWVAVAADAYFRKDLRLEPAAVPPR
ncbi:MAG: zinc ribbon domain-containing protein [Chthoniobacter sp.]|nr:zinc ribbon domain-containing protein [Chthoniobacter sp.]